MMLLDLEVARRLYRDEEGAKTLILDDLPIGVAVAVINRSMESEGFEFDTHFSIRIFKDGITNSNFNSKFEVRKGAILQVWASQTALTTTADFEEVKEN